MFDIEMAKFSYYDGIFSILICNSIHINYSSQSNKSQMAGYNADWGTKNLLSLEINYISCQSNLK